MESTLTLSYADLLGDVGLFLGYGRGATFGDPAWSSQQQAVIDSSVKSGLRQFYFPPPMEGTSSSYDWSFLKPTASANLASGASTVPLPDDFGGFEGSITISSTSTQLLWPIELVSEGRIRQMYSVTPTTSGRPLYASLQPLKGTTATQGQRFQLYLFPLSDASYTIQFQYYVLADALTAAFPYVYGGMAHAETVREACLMAAEQFLDDSSTVHAMKFQERLAASISLDRRNKPQKLGYNADYSDRPALTRGDLHGWNLVTVYGQQF